MLFLHPMNMKELKMKSEVDLAKELGIPREQVREYRMENDVSGWAKVSNRIVYTETGEHEIRNLVQKGLLVDVLSEPEPIQETQELVVTKIPLNRNLVFCGDIRVRLRNNRNFLKGMKLTARPPIGDETSWVLVGRCPRWKGRY
jgi:hypothetical protein